MRCSLPDTTCLHIMLPWPAAVSSSQIRTRHHGIHPTTSELATNPIILLVFALQHSAESAPSINPRIFGLCARSSDATRPHSQAFLLSPPTSKTIIAFLSPPHVITLDCSRLAHDVYLLFACDELPVRGTFVSILLRNRQSAARTRSPSARSSMSRSFTPRADSAPPSVLLEPSPLRHAIAIHLMSLTPRFCARCGLLHGRRSRPASVPQYPMLLATKYPAARSPSSRPCVPRRQWVFAWMSCSSLMRVR
ncbi:hypothetical protein B0H13DRAFT_2020717, partial [Mycena leptocephala]